MQRFRLLGFYFIGVVAMVGLAVWGVSLRRTAAGALPSSAGASQGSPTIAPAGAAAANLASAVRNIFSAKCTECHGSTLPRPKGNFGYVLDLGRLAGNPHLVMPFKPDKSNLWKLVHAGQMPPIYAEAGALTEEQKEVIRAWVESGAPAVSPDGVSSAALPATPPVQSIASEFSEQSPTDRLLAWLGKFHVVVVHFPIALLIAAAAGELWFLWRRTSGPAPAVRFCVLLGAAGAISATTLGWLLAAFGGYGAGSAQVLALHRWLGTGACVWAVGVAILSEVDVFRGERTRRFRILLFIGALLVGLVGHLGGTLVHGQSYFDW